MLLVKVLNGICDVFQQEESDLGLAGGSNQLLTLGAGLLATALAATYVTRLAKVIHVFLALTTVFFFFN